MDTTAWLGLGFIGPGLGSGLGPGLGLGLKLRFGLGLWSLRAKVLDTRL